MLELPNAFPAGTTFWDVDDGAALVTESPTGVLDRWEAVGAPRMVRFAFVRENGVQISELEFRRKVEASLRSGRPGDAART